MLPLIIFSLLFIIGLIVVNALAPKFDIWQKMGLSFPIGFGLIIYLMTFINLIGMKFNLPVLFGGASIIALIVGYFTFKKEHLALVTLNVDFKKLKNVNLSWILIFGVIAYIVYGITAKTMFWPTSAYDSITGYDLMGKISAAEGVFHNSIFNPENPIASIRNSYPPLVSGSFSIAYMTGLESPKISITLMFLSVVIFFWATMRKNTTEVAALFFTLLLVSVPEFLAMSALSLTNVPQTFFASSGLIVLYLYIKEKDFKYLVFGAILLGLNVYTRSDGIVFIFGGGVMLLYDAYKNYKFKYKEYAKSILIYSAVAIAPFVLWFTYVKIFIPNAYSSSRVFKKTLHWDSSKLSELSSEVWALFSSYLLYGMFFTVFAIVLLLNIRNIVKKFPVLLVGILASFVLYFVLYYQMDFSSDNFGYSISSMVGSSFKRGLFPFLPVLCFFMATSPVIVKLFEKAYKPFF